MKFGIVFSNAGPALQASRCVCAATPRSLLGALRSLGVDRNVVPAMLFWRNPVDDLARYGDEVIARSQP